jgi:hypothetical protein
VEYERRADKPQTERLRDAMNVALDNGDLETAALWATCLQAVCFQEAITGWGLNVNITNNER